MEHRNGAAISVSASDVRNNWPEVESMAAHEFFHLWNVKRIRPQALEPIDYVHENDTRDLWFCEGVTNTYAALTLLRAGLSTPQAFYRHLATAIQTLEGRPARHFQSVELAGREAWLEKYSDYDRRARSISYYNKGELLGYLLDLAIRQVTRNQASLDDLMRLLNQDFARPGRFYTLDDLRAVIGQVAPSFQARDVFIREYVQGTKELDFGTYLGYAGLQVATRTREVPTLGFSAAKDLMGRVRVESVEQDSSAQAAGLRPGDVLLEMNGKRLTEVPESPVHAKLGQRMTFRVSREGRAQEIGYAVGSKRETTYSVEEFPNPTPEQRATREGWLRGKTSAPTGSHQP
jgi:predicted metalloprotease with PDZ domain